MYLFFVFCQLFFINNTIVTARKIIVKILKNIFAYNLSANSSSRNNLQAVTVEMPLGSS